MQHHHTLTQQKKKQTNKQTKKKKPNPIQSIFFLICLILISAEIKKIEINKFGSIQHSSCQHWAVMHLC